MAHRHKMHKRAMGGANPPVKTIDDSKESGVYKEAEERKHGGRAKHRVEGHKAKHHLGRPGRKRGGRVGADMAPLSSAAKVSHAAERKHGGRAKHSD